MKTSTSPTFRALFLSVSLLVFAVVPSVNGDVEWSHYINANNVSDVAIGGGFGWCATDGGVVRWNLSNGSSRHFTVHDGLLSSLVSRIAVDRAGIPHFTYSDLNTLVTRYIDDEFLTIGPETSGLPENKIRSFFFDSNGATWYASAGGGIVRNVGDLWETFLPQEVLNKTPQEIVIDDNGGVWAATSSGLWYYLDDRWSIYTKDNGLLSNNVTALALDSAGNLWAGTLGGLSKFDGETWTYYQQSDGLVSNFIYDIAISFDDVVWIGTDSGVTSFDGSNWQSFTQQDIEIIDNKVTGVAIGPDGRVWVTHKDVRKGCAVYDGVEWEWYTTYNTGVPSNDIRTIAVDRDGVVWFATMSGLAYLDGNEWGLITIEDGLPNRDISSIFIDNDNNLWLTYERNVLGGVTKYDGSSMVTYTEADGLNSNQVINVSQNSRGDLWICTSKGIVRNTQTGWDSHPTDERLFSSNIFDIAEGTDGALWFATDKGMSWYHNSQWKTYPIGTDPIANDIIEVEAGVDGSVWYLSGTGILGCCVESVMTDYSIDGTAFSIDAKITISAISFSSGGTLWAVGEWFDPDTGTNINDIFSFDGSSWQAYSGSSAIRPVTVKRVTADGDSLWLATEKDLYLFDGVSLKSFTINGLWSNNVLTMAVDDANRVYVGTDIGVARYSKGAWEEFLEKVNTRALAIDHNHTLWVGSSSGPMSWDGVSWKDYTEIPRIGSSAVYDISVANNNVKWIGSSGGLFSYNDTNWELWDEEDGFLTDFIRLVETDRSNAKWIRVGRKRGLWKFDGNTWTYYFLVRGALLGVVTSVAVDHNNVKWVGSPHGVSAYNDTTWTDYSIIDGLVSNNVTALAVDTNNVLWIGTDSGVSSFDGETWMTFTEEDGLVYNQVTGISVDKNNIKWIGTSRGISTIDDRPCYGPGGEPKALTLHGNFPNPFNPHTIIDFDIYSFGSVTISIYNIMGQIVRTIDLPNLPAGRHYIEWNGQNDSGGRGSSGVYLYRVKKGSYVETGRMMLLR